MAKNKNSVIYKRQGSIDDENFLYLTNTLFELLTALNANLGDIKEELTSVSSGVSAINSTLNSKL